MDGFAEQDFEFEGLLNNLQDWELSFKEKEKKLRADTTVGKGKLVSSIIHVADSGLLVVTL